MLLLYLECHWVEDVYHVEDFYVDWVAVGDVFEWWVVVVTVYGVVV